jgi:hypothetical protein
MGVSGPLRPVTGYRASLRPAGPGILEAMPTVMSPSSTGPLSTVPPGTGGPGTGGPGTGPPGAESPRADQGAEPAVGERAILGRPRRARRARARWLGARRALAFAMGIASIFDLTGTTVYRTMRDVLPPAPPQPDDGSDPFRAAMGTILSAHHDAMASAEDENGVALAG